MEAGADVKMVPERRRRRGKRSMLISHWEKHPRYSNGSVGMTHDA